VGALVVQFYTVTLTMGKQTRRDAIDTEVDVCVCGNPLAPPGQLT